MPDLSIDRLSLHLTGISEEDGRRLARCIGEGLGAALPVGGPAWPAALRAMHLSVAPAEGSSIERISQLVIADLLRQLGEGA